MLRTYRPVIGIALIGLLVPLAAAAVTEIERRVPAAADGTVVIENVSGSVVVTGWDRAEVEVTGTLARDVEELEIERDGDTVEISVELPRRSRGSNTSAHLEVRVPRRSDLEIEVVSAEITVDGVDGDVSSEGVSGAVRIGGAPRSVEVETVSGGVKVEAEAAEMSVESVSGNVTLEGVGGRLWVESVSGRVTVLAEELEQAEITIVSGRVELDASLARGAQVEIENHSGGVELRLPASTSARFEVTTWSGRIDNELGPPARKSGRYTPQKELEFTMGGGDGRVRVGVFSGSVTLRAR